MSHIRISRTIILVTLAASLLLLLPAPASAGVVVGFGAYPYGYWGWGGPYAYWGGPYGYWGGYGYPYGPYAPYGYYGGPPLGQVQIKTPVSEAQIYINGSLAGSAQNLKRFYVRPGTYNIEQVIGTDRQQQRVYVVANGNVKIQFGKPGTPSPQPLQIPPPLHPDAGGPPPPAYP